MKKLLIFLALIMCIGNIQAQTNKRGILKSIRYPLASSGTVDTMKTGSDSTKTIFLDYTAPNNYLFIKNLKGTGSDSSGVDSFYVAGIIAEKNIQAGTITITDTVAISGICVDNMAVATTRTNVVRDAWVTTVGTTRAFELSSIKGLYAVVITRLTPFRSGNKDLPHIVCEDYYNGTLNP